MTARLKSTQYSERITSLDFLRGIAILGILFINIENFAYPSPFLPWKNGFNGSADYATRFWIYFLTQGKFYTMFALLFGVGFYIFLERLERKKIGLKAMDIYARRLLWLFVIGVVHAYFIWNGDVLYHYAICGFLLFPFRSIKTRNLALIAALFGVLMLIKSHEQTSKRLHKKLAYLQATNLPEDERTDDDTRTIKSWEKLTQKKKPDTTALEMRRPTYFKGLKETFEQASVHKGLVYYQSLLFPSLLVMILGIILYRTGIFSDYQALNYYWPISFGILFLGLVINYLRYYHWTFEYFDPVTSIWKGYLFTFPKELLGVGYILIFNGLYQKYFSRIKLKLITNIGRMALSNYIFQNILVGFIFYGYGLGCYNQFSRTELLPIVFAIWIIQIIISSIWLKKYNQGPLEYLWRTLTYRSFKA
ncbi:MAG: DUF418 domain-containing protein [Fulvivirga sp.]|uniref:DUF418 domain-containing protein n=1 Tax=Fulvivirga sp. TaxID=1931237 RepID=UPI0032EC4578